ncbi:serine/threonine-protein kinase [Nonomuraea jiangxiensis]|uniref:non-specific serine/threonine protein kinase n=1 Tax=Nonomuraea jiangxiensis TaxID=633440 RepID=A0A1G8HIW8_9ACTN|nr:serine/threonine-protein kinase [Nonomuraea jiangxiensis]SDI06593.1 Serine/threonine protein kinase [Nonomuraea jiangxiensis]
MERQVGNRYRLIEPLGEGGMGVVWRAYDELLDRTVAIKEVRYTGVGEAQRAELNRRTIREARAAGRLDHPSVVVIHDVVEEDGRPWIVMQLVRSRSLAQVVREQGPLRVGQVAVIGGRVLDALRAAHATGVLHRDVKPENVLLADDGRVVLTDFGIASMEAEAGLTATGGLVGTPAYMPPERLNGEPAGPESDLWSLGATLYAAVEGEAPFRRDSWAATVAAVLRDVPRPPARAGALEPVIMGLLRKSPADRISAAEAARLLYAATTAQPVTPAPHPPAPARPRLDSRSGESWSPAAWPPPGDLPTPGTQPAPGARETTGDVRSGHLTAPGDGLPVNGPADGPGTGGPGTGGPGTGGPGTGGGGTYGTVTTRPGRGKALWIGVPAAAAALAVLGTGGVLLSDRWTTPLPTSPAATTGPTTRPTTSPSGGSTGRPTTAPSDRPTTAPPTSRPVPAGWRPFTSGQGRFSIALPDRWTATNHPTRDSVTMSGPGTPGALIVEWTVPDAPRQDPVKQWLALEKEILAKGEFQRYTRLGITPVTYLGRRAADWEFTRLREGTLIHVINRHVVTADGRPFAIYWETPHSRWAKDRHFFETFTSTFRPR